MNHSRSVNGFAIRVMLSMAINSLFCILVSIATAEDVKYPAAVPPPKTWAPEVTLSTEHRATCKVFVGDKLPNLPLKNLDGKDAPLAAALGKKLTVVVFWNSENGYAREQFTRLEREVADAFAEHGVTVVAVNVGDPADQVQAIAEECGCDFPCLLDPESAGFASIATGKLPRTYLCDASGKILWMDIEYSVTTRRELTNALWKFLGRK